MPVGHGCAALLWLVSAIVPAPERFWIWGLAFAIDLGTPWIVVGHNVKVPPDAAHLPERFGLFMLILLGESIVSVMRGMESQEDWTPAAATAAFLGMGISFVIWWWYFDGAAGAAEQPVRTKREALRFHIWSYAHFPLYLGIIVVGVGVQRIVTAASRTTITISEAIILTAASTVLMLALTAIGMASAGRRLSSSTVSINLGLAMAMALIGAGAATLGSPVVMIVTIATLSVAQLGVALGAKPLSGVHAQVVVAHPS